MVTRRHFFQHSYGTLWNTTTVLIGKPSIHGPFSSCCVKLPGNLPHFPTFSHMVVPCPVALQGDHAQTSPSDGEDVLGP